MKKPRSTPHQCTYEPNFTQIQYTLPHGEPQRVATVLIGCNNDRSVVEAISSCQCHTIQADRSGSVARLRYCNGNDRVSGHYCIERVLCDRRRRINKPKRLLLDASFITASLSLPHGSTPPHTHCSQQWRSPTIFSGGAEHMWTWAWRR